MRCEKVKRVLPYYLSDAVDRVTKLRVARHLESCEQCSSERGIHDRIMGLVESLPSVDPPEDLWFRIEARISGLQSRKAGFFAVGVRRWVAAAVMFVLVLVAGATALIRYSPRQELPNGVEALYVQRHAEQSLANPFVDPVGQESLILVTGSLRLIHGEPASLGGAVDRSR
ncbi:MAG: zf-HC2 domain-containing protein [Armatimonadota bacterium]